MRQVLDEGARHGQRRGVVRERARRRPAELEREGAAQAVTALQPLDPDVRAHARQVVLDAQELHGADLRREGQRPLRRVVPHHTAALRDGAPPDARREAFSPSSASGAPPKK